MVYKNFKIHTKNGVTLIEILIVLAIFTFISFSGFFLSFDSFKNQYFVTEEKMFFNLLKVVRDRALNNVNQLPHGLFVSDESFILFQGENFNLDSETNEFFPRNSNIEIQSDLRDSGIIFENLTGRPFVAGNFFLSDGFKEREIVINLEGKIN